MSCLASGRLPRAAHLLRTKAGVGNVVKKGVAQEIYTGTVRTFFDEELAQRFILHCEEQGYRCELRRTDHEGADWEVTVLNQALPDQAKYRR